LPNERQTCAERRREAKKQVEVIAHEGKKAEIDGEEAAQTPEMGFENRAFVGVLKGVIADFLPCYTIVGVVVADGVLVELPIDLSHF
jgi:hypothetical protein